MQTLFQRMRHRASRYPRLGERSVLVVQSFSATTDCVLLRDACLTRGCQGGLRSFDLPHPLVVVFPFFREQNTTLLTAAGVHWTGAFLKVLSSSLAAVPGN